MDTSLPSLGVSTSAVSSKAEVFHVCAMQGPRTTETAWAVIQGIDAAQMMRKGQVLGSLGKTYMGTRGYSPRSSWASNPKISRLYAGMLRAAKLQHFCP